ncbi:MAG: hypothetical protein KDA63_04575, partial [Planctomycetales bacterium]|nr:hypothetical protein [Planctomycetales bacterium]
AFCIGALFPTAMLALASSCWLGFIMLSAYRLPASSKSLNIVFAIDALGDTGPGARFALFVGVVLTPVAGFLSVAIRRRLTRDD